MIEEMSELKYISICFALSAVTSTFAYIAAQDNFEEDVTDERSHVEEEFVPSVNYDDNDSANIGVMSDYEMWRMIHVVEEE